MGLRVILAKYAGFCSGVAVAIKRTELTLARKKPTYFGNATVHNQDVMARLQALGLKPFDGLSVSDAIYIVSAHGASKSEFEAVQALGYEIVDTTCVLVRGFQRKVVEEHNDGHQIIIFGSPDHPEIRGVVGQIGGEATIISSVADSYGVTVEEKATLFCQTTYLREDFDKVISILRLKNPVLSVVDTLCKSVERRVVSACELAMQVDVMVVVGSSKSSNSKHLAHSVSVKTDRNVIFIENAHDLHEADFRDYSCVGVTAGASTPRETIDAVVARLSEI